MKKKRIFASLLLMCVAQMVLAQFKLTNGKTVSVACANQERPVVHTAMQLLDRDMKAVLSSSINMKANADEADVIVGTIGISETLTHSGVDVSALKGKKQAFLLTVSPNGKLIVAGSDAHGTAYGVMEISRLSGVSPWEWWADVTPAKKAVFELPAGYKTLQYPSVEYRGIFINDEDWGLMPWSSMTYEPWYKPGRIGPRTNERIFELMLRLRANTYWPAMHEVTVPFFLTKGNREVAAKYGIYVGGSHCEPMACSTAGEWPRRGKGEYNYLTNRNSVLKFWETRVKEVAKQDILYTIGMRGVHDGQMNGARTVKEQKSVLEKVFVDQRNLLKQYVDSDVTKVPQVFIPYKEVQAVYDAGLKVPDEVTLMWCDDNYGYIRHFPTAEERARSGGNGVYYHVSYWGSPHDYLWLGSFSPSLLYQQMKTAYDKGIQKLWILNVGDIKPAEYQIELFMDMAWNIDAVAKQGVGNHLHNFLSREFGAEAGERLLPLMKEHYRLAYIRKPEFMGNQDCFGSTEERLVHDMPWSLEYLKERLTSYQRLSDAVEQISKQMPEQRQDAYFQLVKYPIQAADEMNKKLIYAQMARHGLMGWDKSDAAYDSICRLTRIYNVGIHNNGKWHRIMDYQPRNLQVFEPVDRSKAKKPMVTDRPILYSWNATECTKGDFLAWEGLGYEEKAAGVAKGKKLTFDFSGCSSDSIEVEVRLLPNFPMVGKQLHFELSLDGKSQQTVNYAAEYHKAEWEQNVLTNLAVRRLTFALSKKHKHSLCFKALDDGVVLDQVVVYNK